MVFHVTPKNNYNLWDYITGDIFLKDDNFEGSYEDGKYGMSISTNRFYYLNDLKCIYPGIKISCRDPETNYWTKWEDNLLSLNNSYKNDYGDVIEKGVAIDVHRSILPNEIVIESDYETYEENCEASKIIGSILERKGFVPHYYYSGNKSLHIHVFLDWDVLDAVYFDKKEEQIREVNSLIKNEKRFKVDFIKWLRTKMISCWDTNAREFDTNLINATHLIRAELSRNGKGFKTFLGYKCKDLNDEIPICNEINRTYPKLANVRLSQPHCIRELIEEFNEDQDKKLIIKAVQKYDNTYINNNELRASVKFILSDKFINVNDGYKRGMFILVNELRNVYGDIKAKEIINDWNVRMGNPVSQSEIDYRLKIKKYTFGDNYINNFLQELGLL